MKQIILHRGVHSDVQAIMERYERIANAALADDFYVELRQFIQDAAARSECYAIREHGIRRVNLHRFPYHFLFREVGDQIRILVVRHHRRHSSVGAHRR
jgi:plasmid stabilization system protein ParE